MTLNSFLVAIGFSYLLLIIYCRTWAMKKSNYTILLLIAAGISITGNILGFVVYKTGTAFGMLNGPLISLLIYRTLYNWFIKKFHKSPAPPFDTFWSFDKTIIKDGLINALFIFSTIILTVAAGLLTRLW